MVLLAAAICTKGGKTLLSRQFVEMTRSRIEGLLSAFPKLMSSGKQHTFIETESVRYVYQPLDKLYILLITTKASNILEDLETLRLFVRVVPEYCKVLEEAEILEYSFDLIAAFDEIVALGYRENVNLAQIRTFTEMDSQEEKVFRAVREEQEREAKLEMKKKARELTQLRREAEKLGRGGARGIEFSGGISGGGGKAVDSYSEPVKVTAPPVTTTTVRPGGGGGKAMKLGARGGVKDVDSFVDKLRTEGQEVGGSPSRKVGDTSRSTGAPPPPPLEGVQVVIEEKLNAKVSRDSGFISMDVLGNLTIRISQEEYSDCIVALRPGAAPGAPEPSFQSHPNIDKTEFSSRSQLRHKNPARSFPVGVDIGVLRWHYSGTEESALPLAVTVWPQLEGRNVTVSADFQLNSPASELLDLSIAIPLPVGAERPTVLQGSEVDVSRKQLRWTAPLVNREEPSGNLEFTVPHCSDEAGFFPVSVSFSGRQSYCGVVVDSVRNKNGDPIKFTTETSLRVENFTYEN